MHDRVELLPFRVPDGAQHSRRRRVRDGKKKVEVNEENNVVLQRERGRQKR